MARAVFLSLPLYGHLNPALPLIRELIGRGDEITCYSSGPFSAKLAQAGAQYRPYRNAFLTQLTELPKQLHELPWLLMRTTAEVLETELDFVRSCRPDYLITDSVAPWGQWLGMILGVPVVTSVPTFAFNRKVLAFGLSRGVRPKSARLFLSKLRNAGRALLLRRKLMGRYGVRGPNLLEMTSGRSGLNIVYTSRYFQPCEETFDERYQFVGPSMAHREEAASFPWSEVHQPTVVYVSLGTLFNADVSFYRKCFEALGDQPFQVILSIGANAAAESVGAAPANFIVRPHVPQLEVLRRTSAFVTHGGMNSVCESLFNGVPVLVIPQMGEQEIVARRVEQLGAGLRLSGNEVTATALRDSLRRLLTEDRFRGRAAEVRQSFLTAGGVARAADAIIAYTR